MAREGNLKQTVPTLAQQADKHQLYLQSVQEPSAEVKFFDRVYRREFAAKPRILREDFCGTAAVCYEWVRGGKDRRAIGVDLDPEPLAWGAEKLAPKLKADQADRVTLLQKDVRFVNGQVADVVAAQNFSFWVFQTRPQVLEYFRAACANLGPRGVFVTDMMGGSDSIVESQEDVTKYRTFHYIWEQERFDPITHFCRFHIHFRFPDGSQLSPAFTYEWRMWTIPEVRELMLEAGFDRVDVYWEGTDPKSGEGNGVYRVRKHGDSDPAWIAYVVGIKGARKGK